MAARAVAPFQYPGGKSRVAPLVWEALGNPVRYVEPFSGSLGVLLARPGEHDGYGEVINDADGFIVNVWRAIRHAPDEVAWWLEGPASNADLRARHGWVHTEGAERVRAVFTDADHYDAKAAAWFIYGLAFSTHPRPFMRPGPPGKECVVGRSTGTGPHSKKRYPMGAFLGKLSGRLARAVILAGDWSSCITKRTLFDLGWAGVFLDPPYAQDRLDNLYGTDSLTVAHDVRAWCHANGDNPKLRIILAGYDGEHNELEDVGWRVTAWSSAGGGSSRHSERLWFSPHCLGAGDGTLRLGEAS